MAESSSKILEGVFAISKPPSLSSAQVIRDLQHAFSNSRTFAPLKEASEAASAKENHRSKRRRIDNDNVFKIGHGGTLDPMATGVLIVGIGRGTKSLQSFLGCTKTYETVVLFGKSTDTYDVAGKIVSTSSTEHITRDLVEANLAKFRGDIKQVPPIYSALKIQGMKAYEYARTGKELPKSLTARDMKVDECVLTEWFESGQHNFRWPVAEAEGDEKKMLTHVVADVDAEAIEAKATATETIQAQVSSGEMGKTADEGADHARNQAVMKPDSPRRVSVTDKAKEHTHVVEGLSDTPADAPAAKIKLTVSSGFYVRSFCHDLGIACGSYATMAELARTRQGDYTNADPPHDDLVPALTYDDLQQGEDVWGPKLHAVLARWLERNPAPVQQHVVGENFHHRDQRQGHVGHRARGGGKRKYDRQHRGRDRNSSSPE